MLETAWRHRYCKFHIQNNSLTTPTLTRTIMQSIDTPSDVLYMYMYMYM
jgi:hypothetical protein